MKTLVELGVEPCVGMVIQSPTHGRLLHHITEIENSIWVRSIPTQLFVLQKRELKRELTCRKVKELSEEG